MEGLRFPAAGPGDRPGPAGIVIDATVVRGLLTPALVTLLGRSNWWFPNALGRLLVTSPGRAADPRPDPAGNAAPEGRCGAARPAVVPPASTTGPRGRG